MVLLVGQADEPQQVDRATLGLDPRESQDRYRRLHHVPQHGHVGKQVEALKHHAYVSADLPQMLLACPERASPVRLLVQQF
jgi:hypothetical protein